MAKILYVSNSSAPGGMEKQILDLALSMKNLGHEVFILCPEGHMSDEYKKIGVVVINKKIKYEIDPIYILNLIQFLKKNEIEVVHAHEIKAVINTLIASFLARVKKRITHTHTPISTWQVPIIKKAINIFTNDFFVNLLSTKEIALTYDIKMKKMSEGIIEEKLVTIPNAVNYNSYQLSSKTKEYYRKEVFEKYKIPQNAFVIGNLSRLTEEKGYEILIKAFSKLNIPNKFLLIGGGGKLQDFYREMLEKEGLIKKSVITGIFEEEEKIKLLSALNVLAFTSKTEGFGYLLVESMAFGLPVVSSDIAVLKEVGGNNITYFKVNNVDDLTKKLEEIFSNYENELKKTEESKQYIKDAFSMEVFIASYKSLYGV